MLENETLSTQTSNPWVDLFSTLGSLYVQDRAAERQQPALYNQYAYAALQGADQSQTQAIYAAPQGTASASAQASNTLNLPTDKIVLGLFVLAAVYVAVS